MQVRCGMEVAAIERPGAGRGQVPRCARGDLRCRGAELGPVPRRLLEVVAEDLVQLDEVGASLRDPGGESLVQLGASGLRQRLVRRVADEQVAEAKRVVTPHQRGGRPDELLAHEAHEVAGERLLVGSKRLHGAAVEQLSLDGPALERLALEPGQLVDPCCEQGLDRRWDAQVGAVLAHHREHLLHEEGISPACVADPAAKLRIELVPVEEAVDQLVALLRCKGLEQYRRRVELATAPAGSALEQLGARQAQEQDRRVPAPVGNVLDEIEEARLRPVHVLEHGNERPLLRCPLHQPAHSKGDLLGRALTDTEQRGEARVLTVRREEVASRSRRRAST